MWRAEETNCIWQVIHGGASSPPSPARYVMAVGWLRIEPGHQKEGGDNESQSPLRHRCVWI